jgi:hypothetical protein
MVHPYRNYDSSILVEEMPKVKVSLKLCTLLKGVPYGPAYIEFNSFKGVGVLD